MEEQKDETEQVSAEDLKWAVEVRQHMNQAQAQAQTIVAQARGAVSFVDSQLARKYRIGEKDELDLNTGAIIRAKPHQPASVSLAGQRQPSTGRIVRGES